LTRILFFTAKRGLPQRHRDTEAESDKTKAGIPTIIGKRFYTTATLPSGYQNFPKGWASFADGERKRCGDDVPGWIVIKPQVCFWPEYK
jgi:hypothetical protein